MPQLTLEYTSNILNVEDFKLAIINIHKTLATRCKTDINNCKTRLRRVEEFVVGDGDPKSKFIHLEVKLYEGRSQETISSLGKELLENLSEYKSVAQKNPELGITVHIIDIKKANYFKLSSDS